MASSCSELRYSFFTGTWGLRFSRERGEVVIKGSDQDGLPEIHVTKVGITRAGNGAGACSRARLRRRVGV